MKYLKIPLVMALVGSIFVVSVWIFLGQPTVRSNAPSEGAVSAIELEKHVCVLSEDLAPRSAAHIKNINLTADYVKSEFEKVGKGSVIEQWYQVKSRRYRNVSLLFGSHDEERIVIGAHYDGYGEFPGADDNASGVAGLIELAKLIAQKPLNSAIEFVGYTLEEPPYFATNQMGSSIHVDALIEKKVRCRYMISLEMIGYFTETPRSQEYPLALLHLFYPSKGNFITVVGNTANRSLTKQFKIGMKGTTDLPVYSICGPASIPGIDFSDHRNYWHVGIPALMITDTAFYRNHAYHTIHDTSDRLDYERMAKVVIGVFEAIHRIDHEPGKPSMAEK